jgi:hypothetical protein
MKKEILSKHCKEWLKNKNINPITKRKINKDSKIYNEFFNQCDIENNIKNFCKDMKEIVKDDKYYMKINELCDDIIDKQSKSSLKPSLKPTPKPTLKPSPKPSLKPSPKPSSSIKIIKKYISSSSNIDIVEKERYKKYEKIMDYFKKIKLGNYGCIKLLSHDENSNDDNGELFNQFKKIMNYFSVKKKENVKKTIYSLNNHIGLYKQIGRSSVFGVVYKSGNIDKKYLDDHIPKFVIKIQLITEAFRDELVVLKIIMKTQNTNNIPCIPYIYNIMKCDNIIKDKEYPKPLQNAKKIHKYYSLILYELAEGDLKSFLMKEPRNYNIWKNCYEQIFMSIFLFRSIIGSHHGDTHSGNFLYRKIKPGGCFCYNINGINYYIENFGYVWMIWDYGNARSIKKLVDHYWIEDYMRINISMRKRDIEIEQSNFFKQYTNKFDKDDNIMKIYGILDDKIEITPQIYKLQEALAEHIYYKCYKKENITVFNYFFKDSYKKVETITEYEWFKMMLDKNLLFSKTPIGEVISTTNFTNPNKYYYADKKTY